MKSVFFIPANNRKFITKAREIEANYLVLDLEDAIHENQLEKSIRNIIEHDVDKTAWIRIPFTEVPLNNFEPLLKAGFTKFMLPKIRQEKELTDLLAYFNKISKSSPELMLLIENPLAVLNLHTLLKSTNVSGICFGSHDYCMNMEMKHTLENLYWVRMNMLNHAKAMNKFAIDIASMELSDQIAFERECVDGFNKGFDAKLIVHPWQLSILNNMSFYSDRDIEEAVDVKAYIDQIGGVDHFTIYKGKHRIIEKPHLKRIRKILQYHRYESF